MDLLIVVFATIGFWYAVARPVLRWLDEIHGVKIVPRSWTERDT